MENPLGSVMAVPLSAQTVVVSMRLASVGSGRALLLEQAATMAAQNSVQTAGWPYGIGAWREA